MKKELEVSEKMINIGAKNFSYIIFGIILVVLLVIGFVVMNSGDKNKSEDNANVPTSGTPNAGTPSNDIPVVENTDKVVVLSDLMELDKANDRHKLISGKVQNTGTTWARSVEVTAILYNLNGTKVGEETTRTTNNDISPGQVSYFYINVYDDVTASYRLSINSQ